MENMGVDYTAFVCWGQRIAGSNLRAHILDEYSEVMSEHDIGFAEYGSLSYGGDGGFILTIDGTYNSVDLRRDPTAKPLPNLNEVDGVSQLRAVVAALHERGLEFETDGEPGWFVCGRVW